MDMQHSWLPRINRTLCTGCGDCITACPTEALGEVDGRAAVVQPQACTYCAACEDICPTAAIELPYLIGFPQDFPNQNSHNTERH